MVVPGGGDGGVGPDNYGTFAFTYTCVYKCTCACACFSFLKINICTNKNLWFYFFIYFFFQSILVFWVRGVSLHLVFFFYIGRAMELVGSMNLIMYVRYF